MNKDQQLIFEGLHFNSIRYKMVTNWRREQGFFYALRFFTGIIMPFMKYMHLRKKIYVCFIMFFTKKCTDD